MHPYLSGLLEAQAGIPIERQLLLPDAFLVCDPNYPVWNNLIALKYLRGQAKKLLNLIDLPKNKLKGLKPDNPDLIFSAFFGSMEVRRKNCNRVHNDVSNTVGWVEIVTNSFQVLLTELNLEHSKLAYDKAHLAEHNLERNMFYALGLGDLELSRTLNEPQKALVSLVINSELSTLQCPDFALEYLDRYPHLAERMTRFAEGCREQIRIRATRSSSEVRAEQIGLEIRSASTRYDSALQNLQALKRDCTDMGVVGAGLYRLKELLRDAGHEVPRLYTLFFEQAAEFALEDIRALVKEVLEVKSLSDALKGHSFFDLRNADLPALLPAAVQSITSSSVHTIFDLHHTLFSGCNEVGDMLSVYVSDMVLIKSKVTSLVGSSDDAALSELQELASISSSMTKEVEKALDSGLEFLHRNWQELVDRINEANSVVNEGDVVEINHAELLKHYEQEIDDLNAQLSASKSELRESKKGVAALHASYQLEGKTVTAQDSELSLALRGVLTGATDRKPQSLLELYRLIAPERLVVLDSALESAESISAFVLAERLSATIDNLIYPYLDAINSGQPDSIARKHIGNSYAANESESVLQSKTLRAQREFEYMGEPVLFKQHISIGTGASTSHNLRLYFKVIDSKVVIAYCGRHLDTASGR